MIRVLHLIQALSDGGAGRALFAVARASARLGDVQHSVLSLYPVQPATLTLATEAGLRVIAGQGGEVIREELARADIVHVSFWNSPEVYHLLSADLPEMRLALWFHIAGDRAPQIVTRKLVDFSDYAFACSPYTFENVHIQEVQRQSAEPKTDMVLGAADFDRIGTIEPLSHSGFNVGYVGTVDFVKMHRRFIPMSASVDVPNIRFIVCGGGIEEQLRQEAHALGAADRFEFRGYVNDIRPVFRVLDVYGYPLCEDTYAASELNLQEVMFAGIPPVVFPYGGVKRLVEHERTGLIVDSESEYKAAIEHLFHHPEDRKRLGRAAQDYARLYFGAENAARTLNPLYETMMTRPKRKRVWGCVAGVPILEQRVTVEDLADPGREMSGAAVFVESLGEVGEAFRVSMYSTADEEVLAAEETISRASPLLRSGGSGGILHYRCFYMKDPHLRLWMGLVLKNADDFDRAAAEFRDAREFGLSHWRINWYLAQCAKGRNDLENARILLTTVLEAVPDFLPARQALDAVAEQVAGSGAIAGLLDTVNHHIREGNVKKASEVLEEALRIQPNHADLQGFYGSLLFQMGEYARARASFQRVVEMKPKEASFRVQLALACREMGDGQAFEAAAQGALEIDPGCRDALKALADYNLQKERFRDSSALYRKILESTPDDIETLLPLGVCFFKLRDFETAETVFRGILELDPENRMAAENLEVVELAGAVKKL